MKRMKRGIKSLAKGLVSFAFGNYPIQGMTGMLLALAGAYLIDTNLLVGLVLIVPGFCLLLTIGVMQLGDNLKGGRAKQDSEKEVDDDFTKVASISILLLFLGLTIGIPTVQAAAVVKEISLQSAQSAGGELTGFGRGIGMALAIGLGTIGPGIGIGLIGAGAMQGIAEAGQSAYPERAHGAIQVNMMLAIVFAEAIAIYALVMSLIIKFV